MAESQEPIESLVKKESEPQRDPIASRSTSAIILISVVLLMLCSGWALYDDGFWLRSCRAIWTCLGGRAKRCERSTRRVRR